MHEHQNHQHTGCFERCFLCSVERYSVPALGGDLKVDCRNPLGAGVYLGSRCLLHQKGKPYAVVWSRSRTSWRICIARKSVKLVTCIYLGCDVHSRCGSVPSDTRSIGIGVARWPLVVERLVLETRIQEKKVCLVYSTTAILAYIRPSEGNSATPRSLLSSILLYAEAWYMRFLSPYRIIHWEGMEPFGVG